MVEYTNLEPSDKEFDSNEVDEIHADLMEAWLNGKKINSLSSKTMFDIQTIVRHYADIMVPDKNVKISYPNDDNGARCSVDNEEVFISTAQLQKGLVDDTIGSMIHELNHIKMSDSERQTWATCYKMLEKVLDSIFIPEDKDDPNTDYVCLKDIAMSDPNLTFENLYSSDGTETKYSMFLKTALGDIAFLLNAVEDVRIDTLCAPNLKKYIDSGDARAWASFGKAYDEGKFNKNTLMNLCYRLLFHHKGFVTDPHIEKVLPDTDYIVNSEPSEYTPVILKTFQDAIKSHVEQLWKNGKETHVGVGNLEMPNSSDLYMSGFSDGGDTPIQNISGGDGDIEKRAEKDTEGVEFEETALDESDDGEEQPDFGLQRMRQEKEDAKPKLISRRLEADIQSFKNLVIYEASEHLTDDSSYSDKEGEQEINYSVAVFDATK